MSFEDRQAQAREFEERKAQEAEKKRIEGVAAVVSEYLERVQGPRISFGRYSECPKCRMPAAQGIRRYYCLGSHDGPRELQPIRPEGPGIGLPLLCGYVGEHLHGHCQQCGFRWVEDAADAEDLREAARRAHE